MDRRSFLKRTTTGMAAAAAALQWKAPERPPESLALPDDEPFTTIAEVVKVEPTAPEGWASVTIDGRSYWLSEITGPTDEPSILEHAGHADDIHRQYAMGPASFEVEMELWSPGDEARHLLALQLDSRVFSAHIRIPHRTHMEFSGVMQIVEIPYRHQGIPRVRATIKLVGAPAFHQPAVNFDGQVDVMERSDDA